MMDEKREFLRHAVATVAYRARKCVRDAPAGFAAFTAGDSSRTPAQILGHMSDLFAWALSIAEGAERWDVSRPMDWDGEVARFFQSLALFDDYLGSPEPLKAPIERLFQGPVADALTHVGQLALLRRLAGSAVKGENYFKAEIERGRVGMTQAQAVREFD